MKPRIISKFTEDQERRLNEALADAENGHHQKAARLFEYLARDMESQDQEIATDATSMRANAAIVLAKVEAGRNREVAERHLGEALKFLDKALELDPYWADYDSLRDGIRSYLHSEFGCRIARHRGLWEVHCIDVSNALGIPGISRSEKFDLECSICGKDPMFCAHTPGQIYDGRLALGVVKNLEFDHLALMIGGIPEERHIGIFPRPLTDDDIKNFFSVGKAREILSKGEMRCRDLIRVIRQNRLGGMDFVRRGRS